MLQKILEYLFLEKIDKLKIEKMIENKYATALDGLIIENPVKSFFDFCKERENIRISRENGEDFPWSADEILSLIHI